MVSSTSHMVSIPVGLETSLYFQPNVTSADFTDASMDLAAALTGEHSIFEKGLTRTAAIGAMIKGNQVSGNNDVCDISMPKNMED